MAGVGFDDGVLELVFEEGLGGGFGDADGRYGRSAGAAEGGGAGFDGVLYGGCVAGFELWGGAFVGGGAGSGTDWGALALVGAFGFLGWECWSRLA